MSQENVKILQEGVAGWNRRGVDGVLPLLHEDFVAHPFPEWPGPPVYRGHAEFRQLAAEWTENFDEYSWEEERSIAVGDKVVGLIYHKAIIKGTGVPIKQQMGTVWTVRGVKMSEASFFLTWSEALEAAGLSE